MLIGHASRIGQEVAGITAAQAALLVGIMAVANFVGRLALGSLSDVLGRHKVVIGSYASDHGRIWPFVTNIR